MNQPLVIALAVVLAAPAFTGCLGLGDDGSSEDGLQTESQAQVSEDTGGIEGVVTDSAVQPIEDVTITIETLGQTETTAQDGSFAFSNVQPGTYTLNITKEGFLGTEKDVDVSPDAVTTVEVVLARAPTVEPYSQQFEFKGFLECSVATPVVLVAVCAIPNSLAGGNATNDRFIFFNAMEENPWQLVAEMQWDASQPLARDLSLIVEPQGLSNDDRTQYGDAEGESPLVVRADRARMADMIETMQAVCDGEADPGGIGNQTSPESYCNRDFIESGGRVQLRVFVSNREAATVPNGTPVVGGAPVGAGAAIQQDFTIIETVFYNAPACDDYSVFADTTCPQQDTPPDGDPYDRIGDGNETG